MIRKELFSARHFLQWKPAAPRGDGIPKRKTIVICCILTWSRNIMKAWVVEQDNMLISLYCVDIRTRRRWYLKIVTHLVNIYNVNGWLLYRRCSEQLRVLKKNQNNLLRFMKGVADALLFAGKETKKANIKKAYTYKWNNQWLQNLLLIFVLTKFITGLNSLTNLTDAECVQC